MGRFRNWRRRTAALALLPVTACITTIAAPASGASDSLRGTFESSKNRVNVGEELTLSGRFASPQPAAAPADGGGAPAAATAAQSVRIQFRALGAESWSDAERTRAGRRGKFSEQVEVARSGRFRAVGADGATTPTELVRLKSGTKARIADDTVKIGEKLAVRGKVAPAGRRKVTVRVGDETVRTRTSKGGGFKVAVEPDEVGESAVRVRAASDRIAAGSGDSAGKVAVLRPAEASWYGPGLYGNGVACGGTLQPDTVGVAHKTLPCGTKIIVAHGNRSVKTEVIDRGPYIAGREFDLTEALKNKIGFDGGFGTVYVSE